MVGRLHHSVQCRDIQGLPQEKLGDAVRSKPLSRSYFDTSHSPDKNPGVSGISERYARLGVVQKILRSEGRERYDFFHKNGLCVAVLDVHTRD